MSVPERRLLRKGSPLKNLYMPKASTQDGLDEGILEASLTTFPTEKGVVANQSHLRFVPSKKLLEWAKEINIPASYHPHVWATALPALTPLFPAYLSISCLPSLLPPTCLPPRQAIQQLAPSLGEKLPNSRLLPPLRVSLPSSPTCHLSLPTSHTPHKGNTQNTHAHAHAHAHFPDEGLA